MRGSKATLLRCTVVLAVAAVAAAAAAAPERQDIFVPSARFPCFRQPAIVTGSSPDVILAFAENRNVSACAPAYAAAEHAVGDVPNEVGSLQLRRSVDGGRTWKPMQSIYVGNIDFYVVVRDAADVSAAGAAGASAGAGAGAGAGTHWLFLQEGKDVRLFSSGDDGASWDGPLPFALAHPPPPPYTLKGPAVGHGLQVSGAPALCGDGAGAGACADAGRLLLPFICVNASASGGGDKGVNLADHSCLLASDDHGKTWRLGGIAQNGTRESQLVQVPNANAGRGRGRGGANASSNTASPASPASPRSPSPSSSAVYLNERNFREQPGHRLWARSSDGGESFGAFGVEEALVTPVTPHWTGIVGSVVRVEGAADGKSRLAYSGPGEGGARARMEIKLSHDEGRSWAADGAVLWDGPSAYSDLAALGGGALGIVFENGDATFADRVSFARMELDWLDPPSSSQQ